MLSCPARRAPPFARAALIVALALPGAGCAEILQQLQTNNAQGTGVQPLPPHVNVASVRLVHAPSNQTLAAYYCTQVAPALVCGLFGPLPQPDDLRFRFDVDLDLTNPNGFPVPTVELLAAFTAYPQATGQQNLGAVCLSLCDDPTQCAQNGANACRSDQSDIRDANDFARATANFLVAVAEGQEHLENLRVRTIPANGQMRVTLHLELGADSVLALVRTLSNDAIQQLQRGQQPQFAIPYRVEGTVWINVEHFGRIAANVPAFEGTWNLQ
jgi:hypothetical protein